MNISVKKVQARYHFESSAFAGISADLKESQGVRIATIWHRLFGKSSDVVINGQLYRVNTNSLKKYVVRLSGENRSFEGHSGAQSKGALLAQIVNEFMHAHNPEKLSAELTLKKTERDNMQSLLDTIRQNECSLKSPELREKNGLKKLKIENNTLLKSVESYNSAIDHYENLLSKSKSSIKRATLGNFFTSLQHGAELTIHNIKECKGRVEELYDETRKEIKKEAAKRITQFFWKHREEIAQVIESPKSPLEMTAKRMSRIAQSAAKGLSEFVDKNEQEIQKTVVESIKLKLKKDEVKKEIKEKTTELVEDIMSNQKNGTPKSTDEALDSILEIQKSLKPLINDLRSNYVEAIRELEVKMARSPFPESLKFTLRS